MSSRFVDSKCEKDDGNAFVSIVIIGFIALIQILLASSSIGRLKRALSDTKFIVVSLQLLVSIGIAVVVVCSRFMQKDLRLLLVLMILARWLLLCAFQTTIASAEYETRLTNQNRGMTISLIFVPFHLLFAALVGLTFVPSVGAYCHEILSWPLILAIMEFIFCALLISIWSVFVMNNCMNAFCDIRSLNILQKHANETFILEMKNLFCWSIYLFLLAAGTTLVSISMFVDSDQVECKEDQTAPIFKLCKDSTLFYSMWNFATLQNAAATMVTFGDDKRKLTHRERQQHHQEVMQERYQQRQVSHQGIPPNILSGESVQTGIELTDMQTLEREYMDTDCNETEIRL